MRQKNAAVSKKDVHTDTTHEHAKSKGRTNTYDTCQMREERDTDDETQEMVQMLEMLEMSMFILLGGVKGM